MSIKIVDFNLPNEYGLSVTECYKTNILVCGTNSTGKSRLGFAVCDLLTKIGWDIAVFDNTGVWKKSGIKYIQRLEEGKVNVLKQISPSIVYDISGLKIDSQRAVVDKFCEWVWESRIDSDNLRPLLIVLEEAQIFLKNLKSVVAQNIFRIAMAGRNVGPVRLLVITPRISNIPTELLFLSGQRYIAQQNEQNTQRKIRSMYGKQVAEIVKNLHTGEFIYSRPGLKEPIWLKVPLFEPTTTPERIDSDNRPRHNDIIETLLGFCLGILVTVPIVLFFLSFLFIFI